jgi:branched-chain amino acid transport system permease protein
MTAAIVTFFVGLTLGSVYALIGLSLNIVYSMTRVMSFAQGDVGMVAVMGAIGFDRIQGVPLAIAIALGLVLAGAVALAIDLAAVRPLGRVRVPIPYGWMVSTLGAGIILQNLAAMKFGTLPRAFPTVTSQGVVTIGGATISNQRIVTIITAAVLILLFGWVFTRTQWGRAARAIADNEMMAAAAGVNVSRMRAEAVALSGVMVGVAFVLIAPQVFASPFMGLPLLLNGFVTIVLGGLGNIRGGLIAGIALGLLNAYSGSYAPLVSGKYIPLVIMIVWILFGGLARAKARSLNETVPNPWRRAAESR